MNYKENLSPRGQEIFDLVNQYCINSKLFEEIDSILISVYAQSVCDFEIAVKNIRENGYVNTYKNGGSQVSGFYIIMKNSKKDLITLGSKLGLSPRDRKNILGKVEITSILDDDWDISKIGLKT